LQAVARHCFNSVGADSVPVTLSVGTLGEIEWSSGKRDGSVSVARKSLAEFEALLAEDPANAVVARAGAQVWAHLAMMLAAGGGGEEAVALASRNLEVRPGPQGEATLGRERKLVYRIALGAALIGAGRFGEAEREIHAALVQNQDWDINHDLLWCTYHLLVKAMEAEGEREAAFGAGVHACSWSGRSDIQ
jgi:hypothetical protein